MGLLAIFTDQIRPPIKTQKEEKLTILNTYAFTIDQVPHVFGDCCFVGHKYKYMEKSTERRFPTQICTKDEWKGPSTQVIRVKYRPRSSPGPFTDPPCEGGGERARSGSGRPQGVGDPPPAPLCHPFIWRSHEAMQGWWRLSFAPNLASTPPHTSV